MAQAGQKTLILDADFRKPMQHNIFDFDNEKGLSHILSGQASLEEVIRTSPVDKLDILIMQLLIFPEPIHVLILYLRFLVI